MSTIKLTSSSELMDDYRRITVADSSKYMRSQLMNGKILFFSIGYDGKFYLCIQSENKETEWEKICLDDSLTEVTRKTFKVKQFDAVVINHLLYMAVAVTIESKDYLFFSVSAKADKPEWKKTYTSECCNCSVANLFVCGDKEDVYLIVDTTWERKIKRYRINLADGQWQDAFVALDISADTQSCIGRSREEPVKGTYLLDRAKNFLLYMPAYNYYDPQVSPTAFTLSAMEKMKAIASFAFTDEEGISYTDLFVCAGQGLYFYPNEEQEQDAKPYLLKMSEKFNTLIQFQVFAIDDRIVVWGLNQEGELFTLSCPRDSIKQDYMWSEVCVINTDITYFLALEDAENNTCSYFAVTQDNKLLIGEQSRPNGLWSEHPMELPSTGDALQKVAVYRTRITVTDKELPVTGYPVHITPLEDGLVYINGKARRMKAYKPVTEHTDSTGCIKIVQHLFNDITSINFQLETAENNSRISVNPSTTPLNKLLALDTAQALKDAHLPGSEERLVNIDKKEELESVARMIGALKEQKARLAPNGSITPFDQFCHFHGETVMLEIRKDGISHYVGHEALLRMPVMEDAGFLTDHIGNMFRHCWQLIKKGWKCIRFFFKKAGEFIVEIAGKVFSFLIDCFNKVVEALKMIFEAIKTAVEKVIQFLKYLFNWKDIKKMKRALANCLGLCKDELISKASSLEGEIDKYLTDFLKAAREANPQTAESLLTPANSILTKKIGETGTLGKKCDLSVTDTFLFDHFSENMNEARMVTDSMDTADTEFEEVINRLKEALGTETDIIRVLGEELMAVISNIGAMPFGEVLNKLLSILTNAILSTAANVGKTVVGMFKLLIELCFRLLNRPLYIPVISDILKLIGIPEFSVLDVILLICSMIATPILKLVMKEEKFKQIDFDKMINAQSLNELRTSEQRTATFDADQWVFIDYENKILSQVFLGVGATASFLEMFLNLPGEVKNKIVTFSQLTVGVINSLSNSLASGFYSSCSLEDSGSKVSGVFGMTFDLVSMASLFIDKIPHLITKDKVSKSGMVKHVVNTLNVIAAAGTIICKIIEMIKVGKKGGFSQKEQTLYYINSSACFVGNVNTCVCVGCAYAEEAKNPYLIIALKSVSVALSVGVIGLTIANAALIE